MTKALRFVNQDRVALERAILIGKNHMRTPLRACGASVVKAKCTLIVNFHTSAAPFAVVRVDFGTDFGVQLLPVTGSSAGGKLTPSN